MKITKDDKSFSDYRLVLSYGQLVAIRDGLQAAHAEPMADEMLQEISFYLENIPGPGESKEEFEAREDTGKGIEDAANNPEGEPGAEGLEPGVPSAEGEDDFVGDLPDEGAPLDDGGEEGAEEGSPLPPPPPNPDEEESKSPVPPAPEE